MKTVISSGPKRIGILTSKHTTNGTEASPEVSHHFLVAAHDTFALLRTQPNMGRHPVSIILS